MGMGWQDLGLSCELSVACWAGNIALPICNFSVILTLELSCALCYNLIAGHLRDPLPLYV